MVRNTGGHSTPQYRKKALFGKSDCLAYAPTILPKCTMARLATRKVFGLASFLVVPPSGSCICDSLAVACHSLWTAPLPPAEQALHEAVQDARDVACLAVEMQLRGRLARGAVGIGRQADHKAADLLTLVPRQARHQMIGHSA